MGVYKWFAGWINSLFEVIFVLAESLSEDAIVTFSSANDQTAYSGVWSFCTNVASNVIVPVGIVMVVIYFVISLMERASTDKVTFEIYLKEIIRLCFGLYLVTNAVDIMVGLIGIGNGILSAANNYKELLVGSNGGGFGEIVSADAAKQMGVLGSLLMTIIVGFFILVQLLISGLMKAIYTARILDIAVRTTFAPVALSDSFAGNFLNSHAMNFLRSFGAVCLQGVIITVIAKVYPLLLGGIIDEAINLPDVGIILTELRGVLQALLKLIKMIAISIACLVLMFKSGSIAKEVLGAR